MFNRVPTDTALMVVDDVVDNLPFIVRRDHRIVAARLITRRGDGLGGNLRVDESSCSERIVPEGIASARPSFLPCAVIRFFGPARLTAFGTLANANARRSRHRQEPCA